MFNKTTLTFLLLLGVYASLQTQSVVAQPKSNKVTISQLSINSSFHDLEKAQWISDERLLPLTDSLFYLSQPAPIFRRIFSVSGGKIKKVMLYITAAGYYKATINGKMIGYSSLEPAWTDFSKRIYYSIFDLTKEVVVGENCVGVELGNGFYNPLPLRMFGSINLRERLTVGKPAFIARLVIHYENGTSQEICTDPSWKYSYGPIMKKQCLSGCYIRCTERA